MDWWTAVAKQLKKKDYRLSFNLSTEVGKDTCERNNRSSESLREKTDKYNLWTRNVTKAIRKTGGNNAQRILILGSPKKLPRTYLKSIQKSMKMITIRWLSGIFMHLVQTKCSVPRSTGATMALLEAETMSKQQLNKQQITRINLICWRTSVRGCRKITITESEAINFARFFVAELGKVNIPWSLNALDSYYNTKNKTWLSGDQEIQKRKLNMSMILDNIRELMPQILRTYCRRI